MPEVWLVVTQKMLGKYIRFRTFLNEYFECFYFLHPTILAYTNSYIYSDKMQKIRVYINTFVELMLCKYAHIDFKLC